VGCQATNERRIRAALTERLAVVRAACERAGTTFPAWYEDGAEIGDGMRIFRRAGLVGVRAFDAWGELRRIAEATDQTVLELLWAYQVEGY
jgi:hypothetical protein